VEKLLILNPVNGTDCFLIDNCGYIYNTWSSNYRPGLSAFLSQDGSLYRAGRIASSDFGFGGIGGVIEKYSWDGDLIWSFNLATDKYHMHHDFELMDNGNLLVVAWEKIELNELISLGRDTTSDQDLFSEIIFEIDPENQFETVWMWRAIDHTIQNIDPLLPNFSEPENNPNRFDINLNNPANGDWLHINSIDYNSDLDQILLSGHGINEIFIIDHSTTTLESVGSNGGLAGQGGDLLFRWGSPNNYLSDEDIEPLLFSQHAAEWITDGEAQEDRVLFFNNGRKKKDGSTFSSVDEIRLDRTNYNYNFRGNENQQKNDLIWSYNQFGEFNLDSKIMSGALRLIDNHTLITEAVTGRIIEIDEDKNIVWSYINPVGVNQIYEQGEQAFANNLFNTVVYSEQYFDEELKLEHDFQTIEITDDSSCLISSSVYNLSYDTTAPILRVNGNELYITHNEHMILRIHDLSSRMLHQDIIDKSYYLNMSEFKPGLYIIQLFEESMNTRFDYKIFTH
jgi:hypothetical protein